MKFTLVMTDDGTPLPPDWRGRLRAIEDLGEEPIDCLACNFPGYVDPDDERGTLIRHPGRVWPCRVAPGVK